MKLANCQRYDSLPYSILLRDYWQLSLSKSLLKYQSLITSYGVYELSCVLHWTTNAVMHLRSTLTAHLPEKHLKNILEWLDDILVNSKTVTDHFNAIFLLFEACIEYSLIRNLKNVSFSTRSLVVAVISSRLGAHLLTQYASKGFDKWPIQ